MLELMAHLGSDRSLKILCLGAHSDDIEIGCGGTILRLIQLHPRVQLKWIVLSAHGERENEAFQSANLFLQGADTKEIAFQKFRDGFFPYVGGEVKEYFEALKRSIDPDIIFTHFRNDMHQDHRLVSEITWNTFRDHFILEYEIVKFDGDLGNPNMFVPLNRKDCEKKIKHIKDCFLSQATRQWFREDTYYSIMRLRGIECNAPEGYAEGFHGRKTTLTF